MTRLAERLASWEPVDRAVAAYALFVAVLAVIGARAIPLWPALVAAHGALIAILVWLPPRGHDWERPRAGDSGDRRAVRRTARFLRYTYPALLLTPFFEEVQLTVNALTDQPYWFEPVLYAADQALFGTTPSIAISRAEWPLVDELMHAFYISYYPLIAGGVILAWIGPGHGHATPGPGFSTALTSMMLGFFFAYVWYPFLPARGPWENAELMAGVRPFDGPVFTPLVQWIIDRAAVSGGCFPSAHVSGTWGLMIGLAGTDRRRAAWFAVLAAGLSVSCVYTRYHHAVDVFAGLVVGAAGGVLGRVVTRRAAHFRADRG